MSHIGHNNPPQTLAERFAACMDKLRAIGLSGSVCITEGLVLVECRSKFDASTWRKAIKTAATKAGVISIETRPQKGHYIFTIHTN